MPYIPEEVANFSEINSGKYYDLWVRYNLHILENYQNLYSRLEELKKSPNSITDEVKNYIDNEYANLPVLDYFRKVYGGKDFDQETPFEIPSWLMASVLKSSEIQDYRFSQTIFWRAWQDIVNNPERKHNDSICVEMPTGIGKTLLEMTLAVNTPSNIKKILVFPQIRIAQQAIDYLEKIYPGKDISYVFSKFDGTLESGRLIDYGLDGEIVVFVVDSFNNLQENSLISKDQIDDLKQKQILLIGDEAHNYSAKDGLFYEQIQNFPNIFGLYFTASPYRHLSPIRPEKDSVLVEPNGRNFYISREDLPFYNVVYQNNREWSVENEEIVPIKQLDLDLPNSIFSSQKMSDTSDKEVKRLQRQDWPIVVDRIIQEFKHNTELRKRKCSVIYAPYDTKLVHKLRDKILENSAFFDFIKDGECFVVLSSRGSEVYEKVQDSFVKVETKDAWSYFYSTKTKITINMGMVKEGIDNPNIDTIVVANMLWKVSDILQIVGRGGRKYEGKEEVLYVQIKPEGYEDYIDIADIVDTINVGHHTPLDKTPHKQNKNIQKNKSKEQKLRKEQAKEVTINKFDYRELVEFLQKQLPSFKTISDTEFYNILGIVIKNLIDNKQNLSLYINNNQDVEFWKKSITPDTIKGCQFSNSFAELLRQQIVIYLQKQDEEEAERLEITPVQYKMLKQKISRLILKVLNLFPMDIEDQKTLYTHILENHNELLKKEPARNKKFWEETLLSLGIKLFTPKTIIIPKTMVKTKKQKLPNVIDEDVTPQFNTLSNINTLVGIEKIEKNSFYQRLCTETISEKSSLIEILPENLDVLGITFSKKVLLAVCYAYWFTNSRKYLGFFKGGLFDNDLDKNRNKFFVPVYFKNNVATTMGLKNMLIEVSATNYFPELNALQERFINNTFKKLHKEIREIHSCLEISSVQDKIFFQKYLKEVRSAKTISEEEKYKFFQISLGTTTMNDYMLYEFCTKYWQFLFKQKDVIKFVSQIPTQENLNDGQTIVLQQLEGCIHNRKSYWKPEIILNLPSVKEEVRNKPELQAYIESVFSTPLNRSFGSNQKFFDFVTNEDEILEGSKISKFPPIPNKYIRVIQYIDSQVLHSDNVLHQELVTKFPHIANFNQEKLTHKMFHIEVELYIETHLQNTSKTIDPEKKLKILQQFVQENYNWWMTNVYKIVAPSDRQSKFQNIILDFQENKGIELRQEEVGDVRKKYEKKIIDFINNYDLYEQENQLLLDLESVKNVNDYVNILLQLPKIIESHKEFLSTTSFQEGFRIKLQDIFKDHNIVHKKPAISRFLENLENEYNETIGYEQILLHNTKVTEFVVKHILKNYRNFEYLNQEYFTQSITRCNQLFEKRVPTKVSSQLCKYLENLSYLKEGVIYFDLDTYAKCYGVKLDIPLLQKLLPTHVSYQKDLIYENGKFYLRAESELYKIVQNLS
jgi:superfamily II DNA or RNA helicase